MNDDQAVPCLVGPPIINMSLYPRCGMIFEFKEMNYAKAFAAVVKGMFNLDSRVFDDAEAAARSHAFPWEQRPPVVHIDRPYWSRLEKQPRCGGKRRTNSNAGLKRCPRSGVGFCRDRINANGPLSITSGQRPFSWGYLDLTILYCIDNTLNLPIRHFCGLNMFMKRILVLRRLGGSLFRYCSGGYSARL